MSPELSIIIPVYNVEKYIDQCMNSVLVEKDIVFEVIAVDDGSPDNCPAILDEYAKKDPRVKVVHKQNGGVSNARNTGIENASGKWVYFVDSDDWLVENQLKKMVDYANETDVDILFVDCYEQYENGNTKRLKLFSKDFISDDHDFIMRVQRSILCHKMSPYFSPGADSAYPAPWSKLIRTSLVKNNNILFDPYVGGVYDDGLFTLEILEKAKKIAYSGICAYNYRILTSSIVHAYRKGMVEKFEKNCERIDEFAKKYNKEKEFTEAEHARRIAYLSSFMSSYFFSENNPKTGREKKNELSETIKREPWIDAIKYTPKDLLEKKHQYTLFCMRKKLIMGLKIYSILKKIKTNDNGII